MKATKKLDYVNQEKERSSKKSISSEVVEILRKDIPEVFLDELLVTRYHQQHKVIRPVVPDNFEEEVEKEDLRDKMKNKKKSVSKANIVQPLPSNQPTLFQFNVKK